MPFSQDFLKDRPDLAGFLGALKTNSVFLLSMIVLITSFFVFFQFGRKDYNPKAMRDGKEVEIGQFATPKKDDKGNVLADQTCVLNKDTNCNNKSETFVLAGYGQPSSLFWDENYHIASAERYLQGKFFMEPHPGLGKMFIALGEKLLNPNANLDKSKLVGDNNGDEIPYIKNVDVKFKVGYQPKEGETAQYSFYGVRFFPTIFAWLSSLVLFYLLFWLTRNQYLATVFTFFYIFDNAVVVHSRGAMLDSTQLFFMLSSLATFVYAWQNKIFSWQSYLTLGILVGLVISTKVNGLILAPIALCLLYKEIRITLADKTNLISDYLTAWIGKFAMYCGVIFLLFCGTYYVHFSIAAEPIEKNNYSGYTSDSTKQALAEKKTGELGYFWPQMQDHINKFMVKFQEGVPKWDPTKGQSENGSLPFTWPVGVKPIRYSAHRSGSCSTKPYPQDCRFSYLYLLPNLVAWVGAFVGILLSLALIAGKLLFGLKIKDNNQFFFISLFSGFYIAYMFAISRIDRVMYLYHYLIPLIFATISAALITNYILAGRSRKIQIWTLSILFCLVTAWFVYYAPFSYRLDISPADFETKNWNKYWNLMMDF
jgi:dolichyl-phosphate-mannose-protein mannosyltransferase